MMMVFLHMHLDIDQMESFRQEQQLLEELHTYLNYHTINTMGISDLMTPDNNTRYEYFYEASRDMPVEAIGRKKCVCYEI